MNKVYVLVQRSSEYDDEYDYLQEGYHIIKSFSTKEKAEEFLGKHIASFDFTSYRFDEIYDFDSDSYLMSNEEINTALNFFSIQEIEVV